MISSFRGPWEFNLNNNINGKPKKDFFLNFWQNIIQIKKNLTKA
jgi:hypothetical protein